jgi:hypothetical protein
MSAEHVDTGGDEGRGDHLAGAGNESPLAPPEADRCAGRRSAEDRMVGEAARAVGVSGAG